MKYITLVLLAFVALAYAQTNFVVNQNLIDAVNSNPASKWKAGHNKFSTWTAREVKDRLLGTKMPMQAVLRESGADPKKVLLGLPEEFDPRVEWKGCIHPIRDQARCGSCWAFGATEALSDRFCIASNKSVDVILSPQDMVSCDKSNYGCNGGMLNTAWKYMVHSGVVDDSCFPYQSQEGKSPACPKTCMNGQSFAEAKYYAKNSRKVSPTLFIWERVKDIQTELMKNGPAEAAFSVYEDFMSYKSGVYHHTTGRFLGGHAIKLLGWGVETDGTPYWLLANSWGTDWGESGFFRFLRGKNDCGIEAEVYAGDPDLSRIPKH